MKLGYGIPVIDENSPLLFTDGYKPSHHKLYPPGMQFMQSYFESRTGAKFGYTAFFGLQYYLLKYFCGPVVTKERIDQADEFLANYFGNDQVFNRSGWEYILEKHGGYLPISVRAVPEGTQVPTSNALMVLENTDPNCAWLVNYLESALVQIWYTCTIATQSREIKKTVKDYLISTGTSVDIDWRVHDFGLRGSTSRESAALGGAAHLLSFFGSDTIPGDLLLRNFYGGQGLVAGSIVASEHSTVTTWGEAHECDYLENALDKYPTGLIACVIDSYDPERFIKVYAAKLKDKILNRDGKVIFRPDSGIPNEMVLKCYEWLEEVFGGESPTYNAKGFKMLNDKVGIIYGDGMNKDTINGMCWEVRHHGWAVTNAFGSGGGLLQDVNRDTQRFAFKTCWALVNDQPRNVSKRPSSDPTKNSKPGRLRLVKVHEKKIDKLVTLNEDDMKLKGIPLTEDLMQEIYRDGKMLIYQSLEELRERMKV